MKFLPLFCFINEVLSSLQGQRASEEQIPLSSQHEAVSTRVAGLLVDTNLDTSTPDTYRPPPPPLPYDVASGHPQTPPAIQEIHVNKVDAAARTNFDTVQDADNGNSREVSNFEDLKEVDCKANLNLGVDSGKETEIELSKKVEPVDLGVVEEEEDVCPICLEGNLFYFKHTIVMAIYIYSNKHITVIVVYLHCLFFPIKFQTNLLFFLSIFFFQSMMQKTQK